LARQTPNGGYDDTLSVIRESRSLEPSLRTLMLETIAKQPPNDRQLPASYYRGLLGANGFANEPLDFQKVLVTGLAQTPDARRPLVTHIATSPAFHALSLDERRALFAKVIDGNDPAVDERLAAIIKYDYDAKTISTAVTDLQAFLREGR
jgi:hypothetical protein